MIKQTVFEPIVSNLVQIFAHIRGGRIDAWQGDR